MEVKQEMKKLEERMAELKLIKYSDNLKYILDLDEEDLENISNLKVNAKYHASYHDEDNENYDEYYSNIDAILKVSYVYSKSNNSVYNIELNVNYNRYEDYNCRYDGQLSCNSNVKIKSESGENFEWEYEEDVEIHIKNKEYNECCNIMNKIFEYNNYEEQNWGDFISRITKD
jgi:hypothetical protein